MNTEEVPEDSYINDIRVAVDFNSYSFSRHKKTEVRQALLDSLQKGKVEAACHWGAELVCAGHYAELWDILIFYLGKHIHLANPKMAIYLDNRYTIFHNIIQQGLFVTELDLRNNNTIRRLFSEVICNFCTSGQKASFEILRIDREEEFDMTHMAERLAAPSMDYVENIFEHEDPKEIFVAMNELGYQLSSDDHKNKVPNMMLSCYWVGWLIEFDILCRLQKNPCLATRRNVPVDLKYQRNLIWIVWEILENQVQHDLFLSKLMASLLRLFCVHYTPVCNKKRLYLLYFAVSLVTETVRRTTEIVSDPNILQVVLRRTNTIYKQVKQNEETPQTEYLFLGLAAKKNGKENSLQKLRLLQKLDGGGGQDNIITEDLTDDED